MRNWLAFKLRRWATVIDGRSTVDIPERARVHIDTRPGCVVITVQSPVLEGINLYKGGSGPVEHRATGGGGAGGVRAQGGPVSKGRPYIVGEQGPEVSDPDDRPGA